MPPRSPAPMPLLLAIALLAGCLGAPAADVEPAAQESAPTPPGWGEAVRVFDMPEGDTYGALLIQFAPGERSGLAVDARGLAEGSMARGYALAELDDGFTMNVASGGGTGRFALASGDGSDTPRVLFLFVVHATAPGPLRITLWDEKDLDAQFEEPEVQGAWDAAGAAHISYFQQSPALATPVVYQVTVEGAGVPSTTAGVGGGALVLSTSHASSPGALVLSTGRMYGLATAGVERVAWTTGGSTEERAGPAAAALLPVSGGHWLSGLAQGENAMRVEVAGPTVGGILFAHHTLEVDLDALGVTLAPSFYGPLDRMPLAPLADPWNESARADR